MLILIILNVAKAQGWLIPSQPAPLIVDNTIHLDDLTLKQKIAQMIVTYGNTEIVKPLKKMFIGGIHLNARETQEEFIEEISLYQNDTVIPFFITIDLEGCTNPFANFQDFQSVDQIDSVEQAFAQGQAEGQFLSELGFDINFAPVVDLKDEIWQCRSFSGDLEELSDKAGAYANGLESQGIIATAKHYPGRTLIVKDPHKYVVEANIDYSDIYPYLHLIDNFNLTAIMVSHLITQGTVDSQGKPNVVSEESIAALKEKFDGLIITDEINMLGLRSMYSNREEMYIDLFKAGNDIILNFDNDVNKLYLMIQTVEKAVQEGKIDKEQIDNSVRKILEAKGFTVV